LLHYLLLAGLRLKYTLHAPPPYLQAPEEQSQASSFSSLPGIAQQYHRAIDNQRNFEMLLKFHKPKQGSVEMCTVHFRCANNTIEDQGIVPIGIPNFLGTTYSGPTLYFAVVKDCKPIPSSKESAKYIPTFSLTPDAQPFDDIVLGPLVGKGAFGRVYRGEELPVCCACIAYPLARGAPHSYLGMLDFCSLMSLCMIEA
jgi:hypothetical protein